MLEKKSNFINGISINASQSISVNTAFNFNYKIGVIGNNDHHFKYMKSREKARMVLIDVKLLNEVKDNFVGEKLEELGYKTVTETSIPFFRGKSIYGNIKILQ